jgi:hypothetical protein
MLHLEYKTKGVLMSTFELGFYFQMSKKMLCTLLCFLIAVMDQLLTKKQNESYIAIIQHQSRIESKRSV